MTTKDLLTAEHFLAKVDPVLGSLIARQQLIPRAIRENYFSSLCRSIIGQQVSVAAATAIFTRFEASTKLQPDMVADLSEEQVKLIGLSRQKTAYLKDLGQHFVDNPAIYNHLETRTDEQVITELTQVKGIGIWTAQMFLMFTLSRPDVFAVDDIGLQNAVSRLYGIEKPTKKDLLAIAEKWQPYRSIASFHLWQSLNNTP